MNEQNSEAIQEKDNPEVEPENETIGRTDNVGEISVEFNVDDLIAELEAERTKSSDNEGCPRKKLEQILEQRQADRAAEDMDGFDLESLDIDA
jgi:hypothetical protein